MIVAQQQQQSAVFASTGTRVAWACRQHVFSYIRDKIGIQVKVSY
jgi:hypothetical protein